MINVNQLNKFQDLKDLIDQKDLSQFVRLEHISKDMNKNVFYVRMVV